MNFDTNRPLYLQVKEDIMKRLSNKEWREGDYLPTESEFLDYYDISRATVRHALSEIESDGLIERWPGKGTIVAKERLKPQLLKITSFTSDMKLRGMTPRTITIDMDFQIPPKRVQIAFGLSNEEKVWRVKRLRLANEEPMGIHDLYLPPDLKISARDFQEMESFYSYLLTQHDLKPSYANETLTATIANEIEAKLLQIKIGDPLILMWRNTFTNESKLLEVVKILYVGRRYEYFLNLYE